MRLKERRRALAPGPAPPLSLVRVARPSPRAASGLVVRGAVSSSVSARRLRVVAGPLEVYADERLVADDPRVVPRRYRDHVAGPYLGLRPVVHLYPHAAGDDVDEVADLTTVGSRDLLDALRPLPPRLESGAHHLRAAHVENLHRPLVNIARLLRRVETLLQSPCHSLASVRKDLMSDALLLQTRPQVNVTRARRGRGFGVSGV